MTASNRILWVTPKWPLPAQDGARVATCNLLGYLTRADAQVDLLALPFADETFDSKEAHEKLGVQKVYLIQRNLPTTGRRKAFEMARSLATRPHVPVTISSYSSSSVKSQASQILKSGIAENRWDSIVFDGLHGSAIFSRGNRLARRDFYPRIIYRAHNVESDIWERKAETEKNPAMKTFLRYQARTVQAFEESVIQNSHWVATVSDEDLRRFKNRTPQMQGTTVPIGQVFNERNTPGFPDHRAPYGLMFLGRLDWPPNRDGLKWFLDHVWPRAACNRPDLVLRIAGSGDGNWLKPYYGLPNVEFLGRIDSVNDLYEKSIASVVPIFYGSGTRLKVLESSRFGRVCLSTALGVEGSGLLAGQGYLRAETAEEWIRLLSQLDWNQTRLMGTHAFQHVLENFEASRAARNFLDGLENVSTHVKRPF